MVKNSILIVDDALFMRQFVRGLLIENGFNIVGEAANGKEAIKKYFEIFPDLVICDVVMPIMNGLDAIKEIIKRDPKAKIIMLSALDEQETVINALHYGAKDYLVKPVQKKNFIRTIRRVLALDSIQDDNSILLEIYMQIIEDLESYIDSAIYPEILSYINYIYRSLESDDNVIIYDEKNNRIRLKPEISIEFSKLNEILVKTLDEIKEKIELIIPYAKNLITESFRFVYLRNKKIIRNMKKKMEFPDWLKKEIIFVDKIIEYLFK